MYKINKFSYQVMELKKNYDYGDVIYDEDLTDKADFIGRPVDDCLKYAYDKLGIPYIVKKWDIEPVDDGVVETVLNEIVELSDRGFEFCSKDTVDSWKETGNPELVCLLVNVDVMED